MGLAAGGLAFTPFASSGFPDDSSIDGSTSMLTRRYAAAHGAPRPLTFGALPTRSAGHLPTADDSTSSVVRDDELANSSGLLYHSPVFAPVRQLTTQRTLAGTDSNLGAALGLPCSAQPTTRDQPGHPQQTPPLVANHSSQTQLPLPPLQTTPSGPHLSLPSAAPPPPRPKPKRRIEQTLSSESYAVHASSPLRATNVANHQGEVSDDTAPVAGGRAEEDVIMSGGVEDAGGQSSTAFVVPGTDTDYLDDADAETGAGAGASTVVSSSMTTHLRIWMHDALKHHLYDTAIFWGDKLLSLETGDEAYNDAYFLASAYFYTHQYRKTVALLTTPLPASTRDSDDANDPQPPFASAAAVSVAAATQSNTASAAAATTSGHVADPLAAALNGTRDSAVLPLPSRRGSKRKDRAFTVSGTGTASEEDQGSMPMIDALDPADSQPAADVDQPRLSNSLSGAAAGTGDEDAPTNAYAHEPNDYEDPDPAEAAAKVAAAEADAQAYAWLNDVSHCVANVSLAAPPPSEGPCLVSFSQACRYLAAQALVRIGRIHDALDLLGRDPSRWRGSSRAFEKRPALDGGIKLVSSACHLRGLIYLRLDDLDRAKDNFLKALALDVKNYDAFAALVDGALVQPDALWDFVQNLDYAAQSQGIVSTSGAKGAEEPVRMNELELVKQLYTLRLPTASADHARVMGRARQRLAREFGITLLNPDVLLSVAEELYARLRWEDAHTVTQRIMDLAPDHAPALWVHVGSMVHVPRLHPALFALAHRLVAADPGAAISWYAVGAWYAATARWLDARRYFGKASLLDPRCAPAWLAFGHSFALQGESDPAVVAYSTAARKFVQSPLPPIFIAMEHIHQGNFRLAQLFLSASTQVSGNQPDPLAQNELGVVEFHAQNYGVAKVAFERALGTAKTGQHALGPWVPTLLNLAHTQRLLGQLPESYASYTLAIELDPHCAPAYLGVALVCLAQDDLSGCITSLHESLALDPRDTAATMLLDYVLSEYATSAAGFQTVDIEDETEQSLAHPALSSNVRAPSNAHLPDRQRTPYDRPTMRTSTPPPTTRSQSHHSNDASMANSVQAHSPNQSHSQSLASMVSSTTRDSASASVSLSTRDQSRSHRTGDHPSRSQSMVMDESASDMMFE